MPAKQTLQSVLDHSENIVPILRNSKIGMYVYPVLATEFTNWRDEMQAWRETAVLMDLTNHMDELTIEGPDAAVFLQGLAINSFANFDVNRAKHFVPVSPDGYVIGDMIVYRQTTDRFLLIGRAPTANWVEYNATLGKYDVRSVRDNRSPSRPDGEKVTRAHYRYQIQGPDAPRVLEKMNGASLPEIKFFHIGSINVAGRRVSALRHGMAGAPGLEISGPYRERAEVREAILAAARDVGVDLRQVGARAYTSTTVESGWIPSPVPAIYTGDQLRPYREWLSDKSYEATASIGGSFVTDDIRDYYTTPHELGYDFYIKFDHDFVGRAALEDMQNRSHRKKVTFEWNPDDLISVVRSAFDPGETPYKWIDFPQPNYASSGFDRVMRGERIVGLSMFNGYSYNERSMLSLGLVEPDVEIGDVLTLIWGEPGGGTAKTSTERHRQAEIRVRVQPTPYARSVRENYEGSWRAKQVR
ncbi:Aminomethyltransferase [compost metagenome]